MKKALLIGINDYKAPVPPLRGCVNDAKAMKEVLSRHYNGSPNFSCRLVTSEEDVVTRPFLREIIMSFFKEPATVLFFFFSGHGFENQLGGSLVTQDATRYDEGISMSELIGWASMAITRNRVREVVIVLDCCHSGHLGSPIWGDTNTVLPEGISLITSSGSSQLSVEKRSGGLFTSIVVEGLNGGAADLQGHVSAADIYRFADSLLDAWQQRPTFKTNISCLTPLRYCEPRIEAEMLRNLLIYFPTPDHLYPLDASYEPTKKPKHKEHEIIFAQLQAFRAASLVEPVGAEHMYYAAIRNKSCRLTRLGKFYRKMIESGKA